MPTPARHRSGYRRTHSGNRHPYRRPTTTQTDNAPAPLLPHGGGGAEAASSRQALVSASAVSSKPSWRRAAIGSGAARHLAM